MVVPALAATTTAGYGVLFYAYGVLLVPMEEDLGWSRPFLTGAFSAALLVAAILSLVVGRWLDRHPPRPLLLGGAVAATVLLAVWSMLASKPGFVAVWLALGVCQAILFYEPAFTVLTKWFEGAERRRAITAVTLLAGLASTIFGPLTAMLERALGWRGAVLVLAALFAAITVPCFAWGIRPPHPPTDPANGSAEQGAPVQATWSPVEAFVTRRFWYLTTAYLLSSVTTFAVAVYLVTYLRGRGMSGSAAAGVLGAIGLVQVIGRSTFTRLAARRAAVTLGTGVLLAKAIGLAMLLAVPGWAGIGAFVVVYGAANGIATLTRATSVAELYGAAHYGAISAAVGAVGAVGGALAPFGAAAAVQIVGADEPVLWGFVVISLLAAATHSRVVVAT
jgi:predicted MFS family arabinose efflux permease